MKTQTITVPTLFGYLIEVQAIVFGDWAAHRSIGDSDLWNVTHVPSGLAMRSTFGQSRRTAIAIAERMGAEVQSKAKSKSGIRHMCNRAAPIARKIVSDVLGGVP